MDAPLTDVQRRRLERFGAAECVDIHCHCLPGLDDGPATADEALALCRALVADGFTTVVATPHQLGRYDRRNSGTVVRAAVDALRGALSAAGVPLEVLPGADVRLDERILALLNANEVLTVGGMGACLLLELPHETYIDPLPMVRVLAARGLRAIVTHPERHDTVRRRPELVTPWLGAGALLQLTAGSLLGKFGRGAEEAAWKWLAAGSATLVATDSHDAERRPPCMTEAIDAIERRLGANVAKAACVINPLRVLRHRPAPAAATAAGSQPAAPPGAQPPAPRRGWGTGVLRET
jgi:protein-tyrosine phosphatase